MTAEGEYHSNFAEARRLWGAALGQHHAFDRIDWYEALHGACLADHAPLIAHVGADAGDLWLFLAAREGRVIALSNYYSFAWRPVWRGPVRADLADALARELQARAAVLELGPLPEDDGSAATIADALRRAGWVVDVTATGANHWLDTQGRSFAEWWAARPGALRSTVQRKAKKRLVTLTIHEDFSDALWDDYEAVYNASWKPPESYPDFIRSWAKREAAQGTLRLGIARIDGVAVAAQFWIVDDGVAYINKLAHVAGHDALSPGTLLTHALFQRTFDVDRVSRIDFGTGDDGYKRDWMEQSAPLMTVRAWDPRQAKAWPELAKHLVKRVAARVSPR
jgi:Acetyltransferase (GNAT) domain